MYQKESENYFRYTNLWFVLTDLMAISRKVHCTEDPCQSISTNWQVMVFSIIICEGHRMQFFD